MKALELSKLDQENLKLKIEEWKKSQPDSAFCFQPFIKPEQYEEKSNDSAEEEFQQPLLWVHQTQWQKKWNPTWQPKFIMCVYSEAEIMSMESAFPSTIVYICDFHREQCWERWVKDHKHGLTETEGDELLDLLRDCAWAPPSRSTDQTEDSLYHLAVGRLKASQVWLQNEHV